MSLLSERLRELRGNQSQADMATPLGIKYQQWAKYERGESAPGADILRNICVTHACSADWLLGIDKHSTTVKATAPGAVAFIGSHNSFGVQGSATSCKTCPHLKKLKALEKVFNAG